MKDSTECSKSMNVEAPENRISASMWKSRWTGISAPFGSLLKLLWTSQTWQLKLDPFHLWGANHERCMLFQAKRITDSFEKLRWTFPSLISCLSLNLCFTQRVKCGIRVMGTQKSTEMTDHWLKLLLMKQKEVSYAKMNGSSDLYGTRYQHT